MQLILNMQRRPCEIPLQDFTPALSTHLSLAAFAWMGLTRQGKHSKRLDIHLVAQVLQGMFLGAYRAADLSGRKTLPTWKTKLHVPLILSLIQSYYRKGIERVPKKAHPQHIPCPVTTLCRHFLLLYVCTHVWMCTQKSPCTIFALM